MATRKKKKRVVTGATFTFRLPKALKRRLSAHAKKIRKPDAEVVRMAIEGRLGAAQSE